MRINSFYPNINSYNIKPQTFRANYSYEWYNLPNSKMLIHDTMFFREQDTDEFVQRYIRNNFPQGAKIVSLGCSSGEEAYSYAIMLDDKDVEVVGFDLSKKSIRQARSAQYTIGNSKDDSFIFHKRYFISPYQKQCREKFHEYFMRTDHNKSIFVECPRTYELKDSLSLNCTFYEGDARELETLLPEDSTDVILYRNSLYHLVCCDDKYGDLTMAQDGESILYNIARQMNNVLKTGGLVVFGEMEDRQGMNEEIVSKVMKKAGFELIYQSYQDAYPNVWRKARGI